MSDKLPTIAEIYSSKDLQPIQKDSLFQVLVNSDPKPDWVKKHPINKQDYIPIERIEWLLTAICLKWRVEIKDSKLVGNSIVVTVRLHYYDHANKEWLWQDGIGAAPLQTDKDAGATDFSKIKSAAVQMGAPAAESYAVKDAAEKIGRLFGRDMNRKDVINYAPIADRYDNVIE